MYARRQLQSLNVLLARGRTHFKCAPPSEALRFHKVVLGRSSTGGCRQDAGFDVMPLSVRHTLEQMPAHNTDAQYPKRGPRDAPEGGGPPYPCDEVFDVRGVLEFEFLARRLALDCDPI